MFSALSIAPAPRPSGNPSKTKTQGAFANEVKKRASAVSSVEINATVFAPNFSITLALIILENKVKQEIGVVMVQARACEIPKSSQIAGQAEPSRESGTPNPIKAVKITISKSVAIVIIDL